MPVLIFANKQDLVQALQPDEVGVLVARSSRNSESRSWATANGL